MQDIICLSLDFELVDTISLDIGHKKQIESQREIQLLQIKQKTIIYED